MTATSSLDLGKFSSWAGTVPVEPLPIQLKGTNHKQQQPNRKRKIQELSDDNTSPPPSTKIRIAAPPNLPPPLPPLPPLPPPLPLPPPMGMTTTDKRYNPLEKFKI